MKKHLLFFAVILMILLMSDAHADEVIMKNGDRLQGEVVSMEAGKLIFKTPYASKNIIPWDQVERLTSEKTLGNSQEIIYAFVQV